jgi:hypothetical protein
LSNKEMMLGDSVQWMGEVVGDMGEVSGYMAVVGKGKTAAAATGASP